MKHVQTLISTGLYNRLLYYIGHNDQECHTIAQTVRKALLNLFDDFDHGTNEPTPPATDQAG